MLILGLNAYHGDAAVCLLRDGILIAAAEEERFRRIKHWAGFPTEAIRHCLVQAKVTLADINHIAVNSDPKANIGPKISYTLRMRPQIGFILERVRNQARRQSIEVELGAAFPGASFHGKVHRVEHHLAHMASCFFVSPFHEATVVSIDGFGDFSSAAWGVGHDSAIEHEGRVFFPHSLGIFYQALTQFLGFPHYGDEYKIMGLAPYGAPSYLPVMRNIVNLLPEGGFALDLNFFRHHRERIAFSWNSGSPEFPDLFSPVLEKLLGPRRRPDEPIEQRHRDIASSVQAMYEEAFFHLIGTIQRRHGLTDIALAGGCAANSVANGKIRRQTPFRRVYVQSAAGDAGGAIGAAFAVWHRLGGARLFVMDHAFWGPHFTAAEISETISVRGAEITAAGCRVEEIDDEAMLCWRTARAVADGKVVGWFQGRMEWGPRALGNRSIVCDPRRADMKTILNAKIKKRESFRPFAPSVLDVAVGDWFEEDDAVPFMMQVFQIRADKRAQVPAVTHVDGSGRLQTVYRHTNPRYYRLIECFRDLTGVPMVLNTSFNENEPVVCRPHEALECFLRTEMDMLVIGNLVVSRGRDQ